MQSQDIGDSFQSERSLKLQRLTGDKKFNNIHKFVKLLIRPLRILQFLVVLLIFALVIYTTALDNASVSSVTCILLIVLSGAYVFVLAIDIISQLSGGELQSIPMFLFSFLGMILFGIAGILLISVYSATALWSILTILCLSILLSILYIIDVVTVLVFCRRKCDVCNDPYCTNQAEILYQTKELCHPACTETVKYDLMTSVSSIKIPSEDEEAVPDHSYRRVSYGRRRQYIDRPISARSMAILEAADIQTEPNTTCNIQSQTQREIKEMPVQTVSKCELCNRQIPILSRPSDATQRAVQQTPCTTCPALMQLIRGGPCCPGCVTGIIQVSQQTQQQQTPRQEQSKEQQPVKETKQWQQTKDEKSYEIVTTDQEDPNMKGKAGTITKLTLASYSVTPTPTTDTSCQTTTAKDVKNAKMTSESVEAKKGKIVSENKEKVKETPKKLGETLIPEKEKAKTTNNSAKKLPKSLPKKQPENAKTKSTELEKKLPETGSQIAGGIVEKSTIYSEKSSEETAKTLPEESSPDKSSKKFTGEPVKIVTGKKLLRKTVSEPEPREGFEVTDTEIEDQKISMSLPESKKLISPPRLVAEMIDRLQEIEGNKQDLPMATSETIKKPAATPNPSKSGYNETEKDIPTIEMKTARNVDFDKGTNERFDNRKSAMKSEDSAIDSSNLSVDSSKTSYLQKMSRDSSNSYGYSEKQKLKPDDKVERSLESIMIPNPHMGTQTSEAEIPTSSNRYKRTYVFQKKNKVEPAEVTHTESNVQTVGYEAESEKSFTENSQMFQEKGFGICSACKRLQVPVSSGSFHYYSVYRDKRGRFYCEFCATPNSIKVLYKNGNEQKRLKCAGCGNLIRSKHSYDIQDEIQSHRNKSNNCPKCGQTQVQLASVSSY